MKKHILFNITLFIIIAFSFMAVIFAAVFYLQLLRVAQERTLFFEIVPALLIIIIITLSFACFFLLYISRKIINPIHSQILVTENKLSSAEKQRTEFSANVSHELATPLTSIYGYIELLDAGIATESEKIKFINIIKNETSRLIALVKDIMLLSKMDEKEIDVEAESIDLLEDAKNTISVLSNKARENEVSLKYEGSSAYIKGNPTMILQLFFNLVDNAIKYNNAGGNVLVSTGYKKKCAYLCVKDTGIGIPKEAQDRVFERFYRVDKSRSRKTGGTGLGLAIVKHIARLHGAEVFLESQEDKGTKITVEFCARLNGQRV